jgi:K(+)-stimulated pyrophosphate-energized sodium pump
MTVATMANARTTEAAKQGPAKALPVAFRGGAVMGFSVAGLGLLGLMFTTSSSSSGPRSPTRSRS